MNIKRTFEMMEIDNKIDTVFNSNQTNRPK